MNALVLSYKRIPHTTVYDSAIVSMPEGEILAEVVGKNVEEALRTLHLLMQKYPDCRIGFKKQRVDRSLSDLSGEIYMVVPKEEKKFREDPGAMDELFRPRAVNIVRKEG